MNGVAYLSKSKTPSKTLDFFARVCVYDAQNKDILTTVGGVIGEKEGRVNVHCALRLRFGNIASKK